MTAHASRPAPAKELKDDTKEQNPFRALIRLSEKALAGLSDPAKAARLIHATARVFEERLGDSQRASVRFLDAFGRDPSYLPNLRTARRLKKEAQDWPAVLDLIDVEYRQTPDLRLRAELCLERAFILRVFVEKPEEAAEAYACAAEFDPSNPETWLLHSWDLAENKSWGALLDLLLRLSQNTEHAETRAAFLSEAALLQLDFMQQPDAAARLFQRAEQAHPRQIHALVGLRRCWEQRGRWSELLELHQQEREFSSGENKLYVVCRMAHLAARRLGRIDLAIQYLEDAEKIDSQSLFVLGELGRLYERAGRFEDAVEVTKRQLALAQDANERLGYHHLLGRAFEDRFEDDENAIVHYRAAVELCPSYLPAVQALGRLYQKHQRWEQLLEMHLLEAETAIERQQQALCHYRAGDVLENRLGRDHEAVAQYRTALRCVSCFVPALQALSRLLAKLELWDDLIVLHEDEAECLRGSHIDSPRLDALRVAKLEQVGRLWEDKVGQLEQAAQTHRRILDIDPGHVGAVYALKRIYEKNGDWAELMELLEREVEMVQDPHWAAALLHQIGEIAEERLKERNLALLHYRQALTVGPSYVPTLISLGRMYTEQSRFADLVAMYAREAEVTHDAHHRAFLFFKIAELYESRLNRPEKAEESYRTVLELTADHWPAHWALERLLSRRRAWAELARLHEQQAQLCQSHKAKAVILYRAGMLWEERLGKHEAAADDYAQALVADPSFLLARAALARHYRRSRDFARLARLLEEERLRANDAYGCLAVLAELAHLYHHELDDQEKAFDIYHEILALSSKDTLSRLAVGEICWRQRTAEEFVNACSRLADESDDRCLKVGALRAQARTLNDWLRHKAQAREVWTRIAELQPEDLAARRALGRVTAGHPQESSPAEVQATAELVRALGPDDGLGVSRALEALAEVYAARQDWDGLRGAYEEVGKALRNDNGTLTGPVSLFLETASSVVGARQGVDHPEAVRKLKALLVKDPRLVAERLALAELLSSAEPGSDEVEEAAAAYRGVIALEPSRVAAARGLLQLWTAAGWTDQAACALDWLACLKVLSEEERRARDARLHAAGNKEVAAIPKSWLWQHLGPDLFATVPPEARALLEALHPMLSGISPPDLGSFEVGDADRVPRVEALPLRRAGDSSKRLLGIPDYEVYLHRLTNRGAGVELTSPPALIIPDRVTSWSGGEQVFLMASLMARLVLGTWVLAKLGPAEVETLFAAATRLHVPRFSTEGTDSKVVNRRRRQLDQTLTEQQKASLKAPAEAYASLAVPVSFKAWAAASREAEARAGLLACGDIEAALKVTARESPEAPVATIRSAAEVVALLRRVPAAASMVVWFLSPDHFTLRKKAGRAVGSASRPSESSPA